MLATLQILTVIGMMLATFIVYRAFGKRGNRLLFNPQEKTSWDELISREIGSWFTFTSILATLTSLATVYVFFIGNTRLFGYFILVTIIALIPSAYITNYVTTKICKRPHNAKKLSEKAPEVAVIASAFNDQTLEGLKISKIVKGVSLINVGCILWLEFSVFSYISANIIADGSFLVGTIIMFASTFGVTLFTLIYGLRGFVFADMFQSPIILFGSIILLGGCVSYIYLEGNLRGLDLTEVIYRLSEPLFSPQLPILDCLVFALAVIFLNSFLVLGSEAHWLRVWIFGKKETQQQLQSMTGTAVVWGLLIVIGIASAAIIPEGFGKDAVADLISRVAEISPVFAIAFWLAGTAALFSTADTQFYSFLLTWNYNCDKDKIHDMVLTSFRPFFGALFVGVCFSGFYIITTIIDVPFEKLVFLFLPIFMISIPAFALYAVDVRPRPWLLQLSLALYVALGIAGLLDEPREFLFTVAAPLAPVLTAALGIGIYIRQREVVSNATGNR